MYVKRFNGDEAIASPNESGMFTPIEMASAKNTIQTDINSKNRLRSRSKSNKCHELYIEAIERNDRMEHNKHLIQKDCTFQPKLITKESKVSQNIVNNAKQDVRSRLNNFLNQRNTEKPASVMVTSQNTSMSISHNASV